MKGRFTIDASMIPNADACARCSYCQDACPVYTVEHKESALPAGKTRVIKTFVEARMPAGPDLEAMLVACTACGACSVACPVGMDFPRFIEGIRACTTRQLGRGMAGQEHLHVNVNRYGNPYGIDRTIRDSWSRESGDVIVRGSKNVYFAGCTSAYKLPGDARATVRLLARCLDGGIDELSGETCCCSPLIRTGQVDVRSSKDNMRFLVKDVIMTAMDSLVRNGPKMVAFNCAGCFKTIRDDWPRILRKPNPFQVMHVVQVLVKAIDKGRINFNVRAGNAIKTITYHDPCHLGRHAGLYNEPRHVIESIPGVHLVEMPRNRERAACCGAGGGFKAGSRETSMKIALARIEEAVSTGASILATACVFCKLHLGQAVLHAGASMEVVTIEELVERSLDE